MPTTFRFVPNPLMFQELARSHGVRDLLGGVAERGANITRATAPTYAGPTYDPAVQRHGEYRALVYSAVTLSPSGWRGQFGSDAPWTVQVEFGSGRPATSRDRPQTGWSPKTRTLGRALDALRST